MKRLLILILALTALTFNAEAKKKVYNYHSPKYWGNIELLGGTVFSGSSNIGISTVHGYLPWTRRINGFRFGCISGYK